MAQNIKDSHNFCVLIQNAQYFGKSIWRAMATSTPHWNDDLNIINEQRIPMVISSNLVLW